MSVGSELDVDVQDLVRVFSSTIPAVDLMQMDPEDDGWADGAEELLAMLLQMGWLPPTYTAHVKAKVKQAYEAVGDDEAFTALQSAAGVLRVELVDPMADPLNSVTLNSMTLGKVA